MPVLEGAHIYKHFGGLIAVSNVSFHVGQGEILGLIGPNGAGKTTFFNVLTGKFTWLSAVRPPNRFVIPRVWRSVPT